MRIETRSPRNPMRAMARIAAMTALACGWGLSVFCQTTPGGPAAAGVVYVRCGRLLYDATQPEMAPADVIIDHGIITAVGPDLTVPAGARQIDFSAYTVLPGLLDAHTHLWTGAFGGPAPSDPLAALRASKAVAYALDSGIVAMRIVGSGGFIDVALGDAIDEGLISGPHIVPAAHAISIIGGHGDFLTFGPNFPLTNYYTPLNGFINSPADAEEAVHLQIKYGAKVIKILASGGVMSPLDSFLAEQISPEEMRVIVEQAHMARRKVAAHLENTRTIHDAVLAGIDSVEHGAGLDEEDAASMKAHGVFLDPTLYVPTTIINDPAHWPANVVTKARQLVASQVAGFHIAMREGVKIAAGSDMSYQPGKGTVLDEIVALVGHGMTPPQALYAATQGNAELLGAEALGAQLGTVAAGKEGDLVAVEGDPLHDIAAVKQTRGVIFRGRLVRGAN